MRRPLLALVGLSFLLGSGCASTLGAVRPEVAVERINAPKSVTMALLIEPPSIVFVGAQAGGGGKDATYVFHDDLYVELAYEQYTPQLAVEVPSVERGTWRVNPDGTMDTIWRLRPNIVWHDGTPLTAEDLVFSFGVVKDPAAGQSTQHSRFMQSVEATDPLTYVVHWSRVYAPADHVSVGAGGILPRHILEATYTAGGAERLLQHAHFTSEFVGLGPYRLTEWERGARMVGLRFEQYYQGRPPLDRVILQFVSDPNTMVAQVLAGTVDVAANGVDIDAAIDVKRRWEGTSNRVLFENTGKLVMMDVQLRPEVAKPRDAWTVIGVRQAFYHAIDRDALAGAMSQGTSPAADSYIPPDSPLHRQLEGSIPQYPFDPRRAENLLDQAGWLKGQDGVRTSSATGERLEVPMWAHPDAPRQKIAAIVADFWKAIGAETAISTIPAALINDREYIYTARPGWWIVTPSGNAFYDATSKLHSSQVPTPGNRWAGANYAAYVNPIADVALDRLQATIDPSLRGELQRQLQQEYLRDLALAPLYWQVSPILLTDGVRGPKPVKELPTLNIFQWDRV